MIITENVISTLFTTPSELSHALMVYKNYTLKKYTMYDIKWKGFLAYSTRVLVVKRSNRKTTEEIKRGDP